MFGGGCDYSALLLGIPEAQRDSNGMSGSPVCVCVWGGSSRGERYEPVALSGQSKSA